MPASTLKIPHTHSIRGNAGMDKPKKEFQFGNTKVIIHSPLVEMTSNERKQWFLDEWEKGNPVLKEIASAVHDCYRN